MNSSFSQTDIDAIRSRIDIVELIDSYVPLKRSGASFKACCPFHQEKTPSFMVNPQKQIFHCFGCHKGGDAFSFLMEHESLSFPEAVQQLAEKCNYQLQSTERSDRPTVKKSEKDRLYDCLAHAAQWYADVLLKHPQGSTAREYLLQRGMSEQTIRYWKIGFAPQSGNLFFNAMRKAGFSVQDLLKTGLAVPPRDPSQRTDRTRFFNRIMFPICDDQNRIVSFGGRVLDKSEPKYMNCPETILYNKSSILYGFSQARDAIRKESSTIVVEGYFDVIQLHQAGIPTAVAPCGTALTDQQIAKIKRYADTTYLAFDSDAAGINASVRKLDSFLEHDIRTHIIALPKGHDPDSFVQQFGQEKFIELIKNSLPAFEFRLNTLMNSGEDHDEFSRMRIARSMLDIIARQKNQLISSSWLQQLATELGIAEDALRNELRKKFRSSKPAQHASADKSSHGARLSSHAPAWEKEIIKLILMKPDDFLSKAKNILNKDYFFDKILKNIWTEIEQLNINQNTQLIIDQIVNKFRSDADTCSLITELVSSNFSEENSELIFSEAIKRLRKEYIENKIKECMTSLQTANEEEKFFILNTLHDLNTEKARLITAHLI